MALSQVSEQGQRILDEVERAVVGKRQPLTLVLSAILAGGHVRTGLEDNLWLRRGERATNADLVARVVRLARELERPVATPDDARAVLGLPAR